MSDPSRTTTVEGLGVLDVTTTGIDRSIARAMRVVAAKEDRLMLALVCEACLEWLGAHGHDLPDGYELTET